MTRLAQYSRPCQILRKVLQLLVGLLGGKHHSAQRTL